MNIGEATTGRRSLPCSASASAIGAPLVEAPADQRRGDVGLLHVDRAAGDAPARRRRAGAAPSGTRSSSRSRPSPACPIAATSRTISLAKHLAMLLSAHRRQAVGGVLRGAPDQQPRRLDLHRHVGELELHRLELDDRPAELAAAPARRPAPPRAPPRRCRATSWRCRSARGRRPPSACLKPPAGTIRLSRGTRTSSKKMSRSGCRESPSAPRAGRSSGPGVPFST